MSTYIRGWKCDTCGEIDTVQEPWNCPICKKEVCESCFGEYGHCRKCSEGKTELELIRSANNSKFNDFEFDMNVVDLLVDKKLCISKSDARRAIHQGGVFINDERCVSADYTVLEKFVDSLRVGKNKVWKNEDKK